MLPDIVHTYRLKGAVPHMEGEFRYLDTLCFKGTHKGIGEVKSCGGGRHSASIFGINRLVGGLVKLVCVPLDIGRKRHVAVVFQLLVEVVALKLKTVDALIEIGHHGRKIISDENPSAGFHPFGGFQEASAGKMAILYLGFNPFVVVENEDFNLAAALFVAHKPCGNDAGVVHHQEVVFFQQGGQVREAKVGSGL